MLTSSVWPMLLSAAAVSAQSVITFTGSVTTTSGGSALGDVPTGSLTYLSLSSTITASTDSSSTSGASGVSASNGTLTSGSSTSTSSNSVTLLVGGTATSSLNGTASSTTSTAARPTNTQPCNGYPEFCNRSYSNITMVTAHNFPFVRKGNAGSNQALGVTDQLNDGIRMLQAQSHYENETLWFCHTSCDLLNVGTVEAQLKTIADWVADHPYDVITILLGNSEQVDVNNYTAPIQNSGLGRYVYTPPKIPMAIGDWPTLGEMIISQKRVVVFMDYAANQTAVPYILDEFSQMWETPFSPTDAAFPCPTQRPPGLNRNQSLDRLYMANHNLNTEVSLLGLSLLVPNTAQINETNAVSGNGSLGAMADTCEGDWGRPPNFLLVDYYNYGNFPGSVFEVAAIHNNVTYNAKCCGAAASAAGERLLSMAHVLVSLFVIGLAIVL